MYMLAYCRVISLKNLLNIFRITTVRQFFLLALPDLFKFPNEFSQFNHA